MTKAEQSLTFTKAELDGVPEDFLSKKTSRMTTALHRHGQHHLALFHSDGERQERANPR